MKEKIMTQKFLLKRLLFLFCALTVLFPAVPSPAIAAERLRIVTTTTDIASIARSVAGDRASVSSICSGREDPHFLTARPGFIVMARDADLWIRNGMDLEIGWEPPILEGARNPRIMPGSKGHLDVSEKVLKLEVPNVRINRGMGDVHPQGNPHYLLDPLNARIVAGVIAERLILLDNAGADYYEKRLASFRRSLDVAMFGQRAVEKTGGPALWAALIKGRITKALKKNGLSPDPESWFGRMYPCRGCGIVTYHKSWIYFTNRFGLEVVAELEPKPGIPPTPHHLIEVEDIIRTKQVRVILQEPFYSLRAAKKVADATGAIVVVCPGITGGDAASSNYLKLLDTVTSRLSRALGRS